MQCNYKGFHKTKAEGLLSERRCRDQRRVWRDALERCQGIGGS